MKELEEKILKEGHALSENILKVDSFINHQVDPVLMQQIGDAFAGHFGNKGITKVVTIESSGIAPALMTAISLNVPMIILKKQPSKVLNDNLLQTVVTSFTKGTSYELTLSHQFIEENDLSSEIISWFTSTYSAKDIDESMDEEVFDQDLYFKRYEIMTRLLSKQYPDLEEIFLDHLVEELYGNLFEENTK